MALRVYSWTGFAPKDVRDPKDPHRLKQVHCAVVMPTAKAFMELTGHKRSYLSAYVAVSNVVEEQDSTNPTILAAIADPGTVYWRDTVRHAPIDAPVLPHPNPGQS